MQVSAEIRWFWKTRPDAVARWFRTLNADCPPGGGRQRADDYLRAPGQIELGIKRRGGRDGIEIKGLIQRLADGLDMPPLQGPIEIWSKWASEQVALEPASTITVTKRRQLRRFDCTGATIKEVALNELEWPVLGKQPAHGCNVELTEVGLSDGAHWWTLGLEAFGNLTTVEADLRRTAAFLAGRAAPPFTDGLLLSYPAWLANHICPPG